MDFLDHRTPTNDEIKDFNKSREEFESFLVQSRLSYKRDKLILDLSLKKTDDIKELQKINTLLSTCEQFKICELNTTKEIAELEEETSIIQKEIDDLHEKENQISFLINKDFDNKLSSLNSKLNFKKEKIEEKNYLNILMANAKLRSNSLKESERKFWDSSCNKIVEDFLENEEKILLYLVYKLDNLYKKISNYVAIFNLNELYLEKNFIYLNLADYHWAMTYACFKAYDPSHFLLRDLHLSLAKTYLIFSIENNVEAAQNYERILKICKSESIVNEKTKSAYETLISLFKRYPF